MNRIKALQLGITIFFLALLAACAAPTRTMLSDGTEAYRIDCKGSAGGLNYCFEKAGKSCGAAGYTIVDSNGRTLSTSRVADADMGALVQAYETDKSSILIRCGA